MSRGIALVFSEGALSWPYCRTTSSERRAKACIDPCHRPSYGPNTFEGVSRTFGAESSEVLEHLSGLSRRALNQVTISQSRGSG